MTSDRFHKAAKENLLDVLKEATKKDCNTRDEAGMTPTLWAAFEGHIEALRLLVAKGGEPDKADYFGNTALHLAAARGHELCTRFLVKFGCNIWSLDIDRHSARALAAINGCDRILQYLDLVQADQELNHRKKSRIMREKAEKDAEKRLKEYVKRQKIAESRAEKEQKKLLKERARLGASGDLNGIILAHRPASAAVTSLKNRLKPSPTYSDIVGTATKRHGSAVGRKALARRAVDDFKVVQIEMDGKKSVRSLTGLQRDSEVLYVGTYDSVTDGGGGNGAMIGNRSSLAPINGHQHQQPAILRRGKISDVWGSLNRARSTPDLLGDRCLQEEEEEDEEGGVVGEVGYQQHGGTALQFQEPASIFNRPGFGSVTFQKSIVATLDNLPVTQVEIHRQPSVEQLYPLTGSLSNGSTLNGKDHVRQLQQQHQQRHNQDGKNDSSNTSSSGHNNEEISIGSAGSLARRQSMWDDASLSDDEENEKSWTPLQRFLIVNNISSIQPILEAEQIDLEALMLLTESDVADLKLPLGPRRKLLHAVAGRKRALEARQQPVARDVKL